MRRHGRIKEALPLHMHELVMLPETHFFIQGDEKIGIQLIRIAIIEQRHVISNNVAFWQM